MYRSVLKHWLARQWDDPKSARGITVRSIKKRSASDSNGYIPFAMFLYSQ